MASTTVKAYHRPCDLQATNSFSELKSLPGI